VLKIALATSAAVPELTPDDRLLLDELRRRGAQARAEVWDDAGVSWAAYDAVVVRSCWDYHLRRPAFLDWAARVEAAGPVLWNPAALVRANAHKAYLRDLAAAGVPVLPTAWLQLGTAADLTAELAGRGWGAAVVKPAVSASAHRTWRVTREEASCRQADLEALLSQGDVLVQEFAPEVTAQGEWSFVFLAGAYSHAVLKRPASGDYRVQDEWGGTVSATEPPPALVACARRVASTVPDPWLYARVDGIDRSGVLLVMELELIEPHLFLSHADGAAGRLADAIMAGGPSPPSRHRAARQP
jgi:glutathione synthase/RimK-type ligase-like ATP-grasp enzyme